MLSGEQEGVITNLFIIIEGSHLESVPEAHHNKRYVQFLSVTYLDAKLFAITHRHSLKLQLVLLVFII